MTDRQGINKPVSPSLVPILQDIRISEIPPTDIDDNGKRWLVVGICLHTVVCPILRKYIQPVLSQLYSSMKVNKNIHTQTYPNHLRSFGSRNIYLNYEAINDNKAQHGGLVNHYDHKVKDEIDLSKLFLRKASLTKYTNFGNSCDATALVGIIINIDSFPKGVKANVESIRDHIRNPWAHCNLDVWDDALFSKAFNIMNNAIKQLNLSPEEQKKTEEILQSWEEKGMASMSGICGIELLNELKTETQALAEYLRTTTDQTDLELGNQQKALETMAISFRDKIQSIEKRLDEVENRTDQIQGTVDTWKQEDNKFVPTRAAQHVIDCLKELNCVTITGSAGSGKTFTARHAALDLQKKRYSIIPVYAPSDLRTYYQPGHRAVFIVDDICGNFVANRQQVENWQLMLPVITKILKEKSCKIIVCCRLQVFKDDQFKELLPFQEHECNLISSNLCLTQQEQLDMFEAYFENETFPYSDDEVIPDFFPLLCSLFKYNNNTSCVTKWFFNNPYKVYKAEFNRLYNDQAEGRSKLFALALCVLWNNRLEETWLDSTITLPEERKMFEELSGELRVDGIIRKSNIKQKLDTMVGTFLSKENGAYKCIHNKLFDFLAFYFWQKISKCIIDHSHSNFIQERLFLPNLASHLEDLDEFIILIPASKTRRFIARLISDWRQGKTVLVIENPHFKMTSFREIFLQQVRQLPKSEQEELANKQNMPSSITPLQIIIMHAYSDMCDWVLECNADVNVCMENLISPLTIACLFGNVDIVCKLLEKNAEVNRCFETDISILNFSCENDEINAVCQIQVLNRSKVLRMQYNKAVFPILNHFQEEEIVEGMKWYKDNTENKLKMTISPLLLACMVGHYEIVRKLLERDADVNFCGTEGLSPIMLMCVSGPSDIICKLLERNADVNLCYKGISLLNFACIGGHLDIVCTLLKKNADVNKLGTERESPLHLAIAIGRADIVCKLLEKNADVNVCRTEDGVSPLHLACMGGHLEIVCNLLKKNAEVNTCTKNGYSPLLIACKNGNLDIVCKLLEKNADVNIRSEDGNSPLIIASLSRRFDIVKELREKNERGENYRRIQE